VLKQERTSFLKKRSKKLLTFFKPSVGKDATQAPKVFWFFFSKKNFFLTCLTACQRFPALFTGS